ncbi:hypothetical protein ACERII_04705 [Evansella sp. AB-rgal1]|uniref:hypothetical protein n=1 Tax=Evansella sp. AB-rgal1 TaxID=3242696 RepID=UPI00359D860C
MKRYVMILLLGISIVGALSFIWLNSGLSSDEQIAADHGIDFIVNEYDLSKEEIEIDMVTYWEEEDRYALRLVDSIEDKQYELALRVNEEDELAFILDVTGQFDEFGLAYCH